MSGADLQHALGRRLPPAELAEVGFALMQARQTILPKRLGEPGPSPETLARILASAAFAPDHGQLLPWRLVQVPAQARAALGEAFAQALLQRDANATPEQLAQARSKAHRSPVLLLVVVNLARDDAEPGADIPTQERILSAGCAVQNMLLMATSLGFGSALTSGKAMASEPLRTLFGLQAHQQAVCFISIGSVVAPKPARTRPHYSRYCEVLQVPPSAP